MAEAYCKSYCEGSRGPRACSIATCVAQYNCNGLYVDGECLPNPIPTAPDVVVDPLGYVNISTFTSILSYVGNLYRFNFSTIVSNLKSGNFTTSSKSTKSNPFQTITTITVPYNENGDKVSFFIIYDSGNNTYFFEIPRVLSNNSKDQSSIAYIKQTDGSISGKIILPNNLTYTIKI
jgi:hypothetical protein